MAGRKFTSQIMDHLGRKRGAERVQHREHVNDFLRDGFAHRANGNSPGTLTLNGNVTLTTGTLSFALASPTSDQIVISGTGLTLTGNNTGAVLVSLLDLDSTAALGSYTLISVVGSGITPSNWGLSAFTLNTPSQWAGSFLSMGGNGFDLIVTVIPEPGTYAAFAGVAALALAMIHRSRRRLSVQ